MRTITKFLTLVLFAAAGLLAGRSLPVDAAGGKVALVIGNGAYRLQDPLTTASQDVSAVSEALRALGFDVIEGFDLNNGGFRAALNRFSETLRPDDLALFYFMGYAVQVKGRNFLLPIGAELRREFDLLTRGVALDAIKHLMEAAAPRATVILLDAGYADRVSAEQTWASTGLAEPAQGGGGTLTAYAVWPGSEIAPPGAGGSLFARELARVLRQPAADLRAAILAAAARVEGSSGAQQKPWIDPAFTAPIPLGDAAIARTDEGSEPAAIDQPAEQEIAEGTPAASGDQAQPQPPATEENTETAALPEPEAQPASEPEPEPEAPEPPGIAFDRSLSAAQRGRIQQDLRTLGLYKGGIDRSFGSGTRRGIKRLQANLGDEPTGFLTEPQAAALAGQAEQRRQELQAKRAEEEERRKANAAKRKAEAAEAARKKAEAAKQAAAQPGRSLTELERVTQLAEQGDSKAQANLGVRYFHGRGVKKDYAKARSWYLKAAEQGETSAQTNLGFIYFNGYGVKKDHATAAKWLRAAAEQGQREAQYNLGMLYENGSGVPKNYAEAAKWYQRAAERGIAEANRRIDFLRSKKLIQ